MNAPRFSSPELARRTRELFAKAGYDEKQIPAAAGEKTVYAVAEDNTEAMPLRLAGASPLEVLIRLFLLGLPEPVDRVEGILSGVSLAEWSEAGFVYVADGQVRARVRVWPHRDLLFAHDPPRRAAGGAADYVLGPSPSTVTLESLMVLSGAETALDLGCGCGVLGLVAAKGGASVVALDLNARAVALTRFNAELNGLAARFEIMEGDLFAPVEGRKFDLIASNPPYVVSPSSRFIYRDGGGGALTERVVKAAGHYLREGGIASIMVNWPERQGVDARDELRRWVDGNGCDAWVIRTGTVPADRYAHQWIESSEFPKGPEELAAIFAKWMRFYAEEGITGVGEGAVFLRRAPEGRPVWFELSDGPPGMSYPAGAHIAAAFRARDFLRGPGAGDGLLDAKLRIAPDARLELVMSPGGSDGWRLDSSILKLILGFTYSVSLDAPIADALGGLDGTVTVGSVLDRVAEAAGVPPARLRSGALPLLRRLVECCFLLP